MPYLKPQSKEYFEDLVKVLEHSYINDGGELNYVITRVIKHFMDTHPKKYETFNTIVGALDSAKEEFRRRVVNPYEDQKIKDNSDVY